MCTKTMIIGAALVSRAVPFAATAGEKAQPSMQGMMSDHHAGTSQRQRMGEIIAKYAAQVQ